MACCWDEGSYPCNFCGGAFGGWRAEIVQYERVGFELDSQPRACFFLTFSGSSSAWASLRVANVHLRVRNGFTRVWARLWAAKVLRRAAAYSQLGKSHLYGLSRVWVRLWLAKWFRRAAAYSQPRKSHLYGLSPVWVCMWSAKWLR